MIVYCILNDLKIKDLLTRLHRTNICESQILRFLRQVG